MKLAMTSVAAALNLPVSTVRRWIRQGRIPVQRSGADVVFSQAAIEKWARMHNLTFHLNDGQSAHQSDAPVQPALDGLVPAMQRGKVCHRVAGADIATVLKSAVDCIDFLAKESRDELYEKLIERERLASTGIGHGVALPHPREPLSRPPQASVITTCFLKQPIDFNAIDDQSVFVCFLMISPTVRHHLHLLSRLSYCIRNRAFVEFLHARPDAATLHSRIAAFEKQLDDQ